MPAPNSRRPVLQILWALYGVVCIVKAAWIVVYSSTLTLMWGAVINRVADPFFWMNAFHVWLIGAVVVLILAAILAFFMAVAPPSGRSSTLPVLASVIAILTGPLGIALGAYTMAVTLPRPADSARANYASAA